MQCVPGRRARGPPSRDLPDHTSVEAPQTPGFSDLRHLGHRVVFHPVPLGRLRFLGLHTRELYLVQRLHSIEISYLLLVPWILRQLCHEDADVVLHAPAFWASTR